MLPGDVVTCRKSPPGGVVVYRTQWESDIVGTIRTGELALILERIDKPAIGDFEGCQVKVLLAKNGKIGWNFEQYFDLVVKHV